MKRIFENNRISSYINNWVDLIFGYKSKGKEAEIAKNIFTESSYQENINLKNIEEKESYLRSVEFGLIPNQIMNKECSKREKKREIRKEKELTEYNCSNANKLKITLLKNNNSNDKNMKNDEKKSKILKADIINKDRIIILYDNNTIIENKSQDSSIKEVGDNANDTTEVVDGNDSEPSTSMTNNDINLTAEVILSSIDTETKWGDMKDSSALPPLTIPYTSSSLTTEIKENANSSDDEQEVLEFVSKPITRTKLNISRIPPGMTYDQLKSLFLEYGQIINMTIKPAKIGTVAFLEYTTPAEAIQAVRALDDAYAVEESTPINQIPQSLDSLCVDFAYSDGITRHHRQGVTPIFIKGLPSDMKRGDLKIICIEFGDLAKTRLSKIDNGHGIKCSATIEYVRKDSTRLALAHLGNLFHSYGYHTVKVEKYNTNRNSYKPHP